MCLFMTYIYKYYDTCEKKNMSHRRRIRFFHPVFSGFRSSAADLYNIMRILFIDIRNLVTTAFCLIYNKLARVAGFDDYKYYNTE